MSKTAKKSAGFQVGQTVRRTVKGLTKEQATVVITEVGLVAKTNNGKAVPAVRGYQPSFGTNVSTWLECEIVAV